MDKAKEQKAIDRLKAFAPREGDEPYYLAYSGGKDSDTILILAELAGVRFEAVHNLTTVDAPETVYYVRSKPNVTIHKPDTTMWKLIEKKMQPPTRIMRYCCDELKEAYGQGRKVVTGVRIDDLERGFMGIYGTLSPEERHAWDLGELFAIVSHKRAQYI